MEQKVISSSGSGLKEEAKSHKELGKAGGQSMLDQYHKLIQSQPPQREEEEVPQQKAESEVRSNTSLIL